MPGPEPVYPNEADPCEETVFVLVDMRGPRDGWWEAHRERDRQEEQDRRVWKIGRDHWILEFPLLHQRAR